MCRRSCRRGMINLSDPDSRVMRTQGTPPRQAYNAQAAVNDQQIILAAEITIDAPGLRAPRADARHDARAPAPARRSPSSPRWSLADAGYWHTRQMQAIAERGIEVLVPPDGNDARGQTPRLGGRRLRADARQARPPTAAASSTRSARSRSSRYSGRSNTTGTSTGSCEEAEPPRSQSGG